MKSINSSFLFPAFFFLVFPALSQNRPGRLGGKFFDYKTKEPIPFANIALKSPQGIVVKGSSIDVEGNYEIKP